MPLPALFFDDAESFYGGGGAFCISLRALTECHLIYRRSEMDQIATPLNQVLFIKLG